MSSRLLRGGGSQAGGDSAKRMAAGFVLIGHSILSALKLNFVLFPRRRDSSAAVRISKHDEVFSGRLIHSASCPPSSAKYWLFSQIGTFSGGKSDSVFCGRELTQR